MDVTQPVWKPRSTAILCVCDLAIEGNYDCDSPFAYEEIRSEAFQMYQEFFTATCLIRNHHSGTSSEPAFPGST